MTTFCVPDHLASWENRDLTVYHYRSPSERPFKTPVELLRPMFSFLLSGEKHVYLQEDAIHIDPGQALLFPISHCLMMERAPRDGQYSSLLFSFTSSAVAALREKHPTIFRRRPAGLRKAAFVLDQDDFVRSFVAALLRLESGATTLADALLPLKFEELMLYLAHTYPTTFPDFVTGLDEEDADGLLKRVVEHNIHNNLTLEELAFLCHVSQSTFKRKFEQLFGTPPIRWFHERRMAHAARLLGEHGRKASEIYEDLGYRNLSSFVQAFKKEFGVTPGAWRPQEMTL
ncbi:helix-turn-helix transcriptional regulator [Dinghuibacter silviterrae]|uniref:AraC-like DNA-binding protein n=1 Tax=Dinghuibacter silviterrae TaxID=1539049 RepID=A0A4R8DS54_9BACT|nr:helix-turn-helix domain-containing protein [Dinghuibacter silviterrae]TDX00849.1 AraC-like DNA-binding protein [Dinghuibacter silviterrae]